TALCRCRSRYRTLCGSLSRQHRDSGALRSSLPVLDAVCWNFRHAQASFAVKPQGWLRFMARHKTVRLAKKKGGSSNFIALLPFSFSKQSNKIVRCSPCLSSFVERRLLNAILTVLAGRHRSHHFGGLITEGEAHEYR